jgi:hypothetical protein
MDLSNERNLTMIQTAAEIMADIFCCLMDVEKRLVLMDMKESNK